MRILVCGSRGWTDEAMMIEAIEMYFNPGLDILVHGAAPGADRMADKIAKSRDIEVDAYPADWNRYPKAAGPIRNQQMLDEGKPELAFAFKDGFNLQNKKGAGTEDMIRRSIKANIPWLLWSHHL